MAHDFEAVFEPGAATMPAFLAGLPAVLADHRMLHTGEVYELERERDGTFGIADMTTHPIADLNDLPPLLRRWHGVSIGLVSAGLLARLGRCDSIEVDLRVCRTATCVAISYRESATAWRSRRKEPALLQELADMLLALCLLANSSRAIYDEETAELSANGIASALAHLIATRRFPSGGMDGVVLLPDKDAEAALAQLGASRERLVSMEGGIASIVLL
jgi:hypothetical protein